MALRPLSKREHSFLEWEWPTVQEQEEAMAESKLLKDEKWLGYLVIAFLIVSHQTGINALFKAMCVFPNSFFTGRCPQAKTSLSRPTLDHTSDI